MDEFKVSREFEIIGAIAAVLSRKRKPEKAIEFKKLLLITGVSKGEAQKAIKFLISKGMRIRLADGLPHKIYWEDDC